MKCSWCDIEMERATICIEVEDKHGNVHLETVAGFLCPECGEKQPVVKESTPRKLEKLRKGY